MYIVNDGGHAAEVDDLCAAFSDRFKGRLTVYHNERSTGLAGAINTALRNVEGDFVVIHDDDDSWDTTFLSTTVEFLNDPANAAFVAVMTRYNVIVESIKGGKVYEMSREPVAFWPLTLKFFPLLYRNSFPPICYLIRMRSAKEVGLADERLELLEDTDYLRRLLLYGDVATLEVCAANYHLRPTNGGDALSNSTVTFKREYNSYDRQIGNKLIRNYIKDNPANLGLIYALASLNSQIDELETKLNTLSDHSIRRIAQELWYEQNRRSVGYKLSKFVQGLLKRLHPSYGRSWHLR